jgi:hypothetical protein
MDLPDPTLYATRKGFRYFEHYERAFASQRTDPITILEIGVQKGGCLEFWADFFVQGTIVGIDKDPVAKDLQRKQLCILHTNDPKGWCSRMAVT